MEVVKDIKMKVRIVTDKRTVEKEFSNLYDAKVFMENFFSSLDVPDRRSESSSFGYGGRERRMGSSTIDTKVTETAMAEDLGQNQERNDDVKQKRPKGSRSERQFLIYSGIGVFILLIVFSLFFKAHSRALREDLSSIKQRTITLEERFPQHTSELKELEQFMSKFHESQRSLALRLDGLSQNIDKLTKKMASAVTVTQAPSLAPKKPVSQTKSQYHEVRSGESLFGIAKRHGIPLDKLCSLNQITAKTVILPGQKLLVTSGPNQ